MFCSCDLLEIFLELASFSVGSAAMLSKSQRQDAPEALQDVRMCPSCGTRSYLRKKTCINIYCSYYWMKQAPNTNLWARGPLLQGSGSLKGSSSQKTWSWQSWKNSGYADGVYQNKLQESLNELEEDVESSPDDEIQIISEGGPGAFVEEVRDSDEEANAFIFGLEKKKQVNTYREYEDARHAWESASQEKKAAASLRTAIKLEKEHTYGSPKAALAAQVALEEGQKWQSLRAKGPASEKYTAAVQRRFVPVKTEPGLAPEEPAISAPREEPELPEEAAISAPREEPELPDTAALDDGGHGWKDWKDWKGSRQDWKSWGRQKQQSSSSWQRAPDQGPSRDAMQKYNDYEEEEDRRAQAYWATNQWQEDYAAPEEQQAFKKSKGKKRKLWLAAQIDTLKKQGRWVGGAPSDSSKQLRLIREAWVEICDMRVYAPW